MQETVMCRRYRSQIKGCNRLQSLVVPVGHAGLSEEEAGVRVFHRDPQAYRFAPFIQSIEL